MPECPEQKTTFLSFPKAGKNIAHWHFGIRMLPHIMILEEVIEQHVKQGADNSQNARSVNVKTNPSQRFPGRILNFILCKNKVA